MRLSLVPNRSSRPQRRTALLKLAKRPPRDDQPSHLLVSEIKLEPSLFQPRWESIAYAPGRSEGHIAQLARVAKGRQALDPVKVAAFGDAWYLLDGHHRLDAYGVAGWTKPIPVEVRHSPLTGEARIAWAVRESVSDNQKNRLAMSDADKRDAAWAAVVRGDELSKSETAGTYGISVRSVATMRETHRELDAAGVDPEALYGWRQAQSELRGVRGSEGGDPRDLEERRLTEVSRKLKGVMQMRLPPRLLAQALEAYEPGVVEMMALAQRIAAEEGEGDDDLI